MPCAGNQLQKEHAAQTAGLRLKDPLSLIKTLGITTVAADR